MEPSAPTGCEILGEQPGFVAVDKPPGVLTHRSKLFSEANDMVTRLEASFGGRVFTVHRLDRKTSGVLLFARSSEAAATAGALFRAGRIGKWYWALVRGFAPDQVTVDRPLKHPDNGRMQEAVSEIRCVARVELPHAVGPYATARYSLVQMRPATGRRHQLRRHLRGLDHPIIGDTIYGDGRHNRFFRAQFGWHRMFLHAGWMKVPLENQAESWSINAPLEGEFAAACAAFGWPVELVPFEESIPPPGGGETIAG